MQSRGRNGVGRIHTEIEITNYDDLVLVENGTLPPDRVRRVTIPGLVDPGATKLVLPEAVVKRLGLQPAENTTVQYADGRTAERRQARGAHVRLAGREDVFKAIVEPRRRTALIGAVVLECLDLLADCSRQRVVPRDPRGPIYEIE
jgi:predicted aspartyl protease